MVVKSSHLSLSPVSTSPLDRTFYSGCSGLSELPDTAVPRQEGFFYSQTDRDLQDSAGAFWAPKESSALICSRAQFLCGELALCRAEEPHITGEELHKSPVSVLVYRRIPWVWLMDTFCSVEPAKGNESFFLCTIPWKDTLTPKLPRAHRGPPWHGVHLGKLRSLLGCVFSGSGPNLTQRGLQMLCGLI